MYSFLNNISKLINILTKEKNVRFNMPRYLVISKFGNPQCTMLFDRNECDKNDLQNVVSIPN